MDPATIRIHLADHGPAAFVPPTGPSDLHHGLCRTLHPSEWSLAPEHARSRRVAYATAAQSNPTPSSSSREGAGQAWPGSRPSRPSTALRPGPTAWRACQVNRPNDATRIAEPLEEFGTGCGGWACSNPKGEGQPGFGWVADGAAGGGGDSCISSSLARSAVFAEVSLRADVNASPS